MNEYEEALRDYQNYVVEELAEQFNTLPPEQWEQLEPHLPVIEDVGNGLVECIAMEEPDKESLELALYFAANICRYLEMRREMRQVDWLEMGLKAARSRADRGKESLFLNDLALYYSAIGEKAKALGYYEQSLSIDRELSDRQSEAIVINNIGMIYLDIGEQSKALEYFELALTLRRELGNHQGEAAALNNIGIVYFDIAVYWGNGEREKAMQLMEQAETLLKVVQSPRVKEVTETLTQWRSELEQENTGRDGEVASSRW
jgi:tetratricopeptide (TPR) repeat protein